MRLLKLEAWNFGSYEHFEFDFTNVGLALISGKTGSGKSTIQDLVPWVLYGQTAKGGAVDDVRSWTNPKERTLVTLSIQHSGGTTITVSRQRGPNDLFWIEQEHSNNEIRGKDIPDTQRLLEARLGVDSDTYLSSAYFHEFSDAANFFTATARSRRECFERIAELDLPSRLLSGASNGRTDIKKQISVQRDESSRLEGTVRGLIRGLETNKSYVQTWEFDQEKEKISLLEKSNDFQKEKKENISEIQAKIDSLPVADVDALTDQIDALRARIGAIKDKKCDKCGSLTKSNERAALAEKVQPLQQELTSAMSIMMQTTYLQQELTKVIAQPNNYLKQLEQKKIKENPYLNLIAKQGKELKQAEDELRGAEARLAWLELRLSALDRLYSLAGDLRGELLQRTIREIQDETNRYLETYFDGEIYAEFYINAGDSLEVKLMKNGYKCNYKQLSKGQRQLLRLSFVCAMMKATANRAGAHFSTLFFDEALDGLDVSLKVKAHRLFCELAKDHEGVLVIDHSEELKSLFDRKFKVTMESDISHMVEDEE